MPVSSEKARLIFRQNRNTPGGNISQNFPNPHPPQILVNGTNQTGKWRFFFRFGFDFFDGVFEAGEQFVFGYEVKSMGGEAPGGEIRVPALMPFALLPE
ncbi:MAG: hypothetical protein R3C61_15210 [Bacteroidia bacterium]